MPSHYHQQNQPARGGGPRTFGGRNVGGFQIPEYPATPAPLDRDEIRQFSQRRRQASRGLEQAIAQRDRGAAQARQRFDRLQSDLDRQAEDAELSQRAQLGQRGLARQPRGMGRALRDIRDERASAAADARQEKADRLAALDFAVQQARADRDRELGQIRADKVARRTALDRLLGGAR